MTPNKNNMTIDNGIFGDMEPQLDFRLRSLIYLLEVAKSKSQTEASQKLGISQSALSQSIEALEKDWGVRIFDQDGRRKLLTEAGDALVKYATEIVGRTFELKDWLDSLMHGRLGVFRVGMIDSANLYILPNALTKFRKKYPEVELNLFVSSSDLLFEKLANFELDLVFINYSQVNEESFQVEEIFTENLFLYSPKKLDPKTGPWALYPTDSRTRKIIDKALYSEDINPNVILESSNPQILSQMVKLGFCNSVLPLDEASNGIAELKCHKIATRRLVALTRKSSAKNILSQTLIDLAKTSVEK